VLGLAKVAHRKSHAGRKEKAAPSKPVEVEAETPESEEKEG